VYLSVKHCLFRASAVVAVDPNLKRPPSGQFSWHGDANQYDIEGPSWLVLSAVRGSPLLTAGATDLESWLRTVGEETNPIKSKPKLKIDPAARQAPLQPRDFAVEEEPQAKNHPGADPLRVGPWSRP
jgi:hypothetical protein